MLSKTNTRATRADKEKKKKIAFFCQREGQVKEGCFKLNGYPEWWPGTKNKEKPKAAMAASPVPSLTDEQYHMFVTHFKDNGGMEKNTSQPRANMAGKVNNSNS